MFVPRVDALTYTMRTTLKNMGNNSYEIKVSLQNITDTSYGIAACSMNIELSENVKLNTKVRTLSGWSMTVENIYLFDTGNPALKNTDFIIIPVSATGNGVVTISNIKCSDGDTSVSVDNKVIDNKDNLVKDKVPHSEGNLENKAIDEAQAIESRPIDESKPIEKKPVDKTRGGIFTKDEAKNATVVIKENIDEIVGIDGKVYGPFLADDVVVLPNITAQIIIDSNKATLVNN